MTGMGISRLTVKKILNQAERDVTAVYDRHSYDPEKRAALVAWGRRLEAIVGGDQRPVVVPLQRPESAGPRKAARYNRAQRSAS